MYDEDDFYDEPDDEKDLNALIDEWLSNERPERYESADKDWMHPVIEKAAIALRRRQADDEVISDAARRRVYTREGMATKRTNRILRDISDSGQLPLGWGEGQEWKQFFVELLQLPLSIDRTRVCFGAATARDLEQWELQSAREEDKRRIAEMKARSGARLLAEMLREQGAERVDQLHPLDKP